MDLKAYQKEYHAKWYLRNRSKSIAQSKEWQSDNKDKVNKRTMAWRMVNKEKAKSCTSRWRVENKHRVLTTAKQWYASNPERILGYRLKKKYGISLQEFKDLVAKQNGVCLICNGDNSGKCLRVDHDHATGTVRGLLCDNCNIGLGHFKDNEEIMLSAITYLKRTSISSTGVKHVP